MAAPSGPGYASRASYIPLRLDPTERSLLRVLEGALSVSEYTDKVDVITWRASKVSRVSEQVSEMLACIAGLMLASNYREAKQLFEDQELGANEEFFRRIFEIGRRYKVMNPDQMRSSYGKLMYMLQDAAAPEVRNSLNLDLDSQSVSVHAELERLGCVDLLSDAECAAAVLPLGPSELAERKSTAVASLLQRYGGEDEALRWRLEWVILSLGDDEALTQAHVTPVRRMIQMLREHFDVTYTDKAFSLAIQAGRNGARLTHSHATQFAYVEQSLHLWQAILSQLARLWSLAEGDLLRGGEYRLRDTGQGLNRVQAAPTVGRFMHSVLGQLQGQVGGWVGSAAVHLGDNDVPNALHWIDKYTQIPRILTPVLDTLSTLDTLLTDTPAMDDYVKDAFGSADNCRKSILADFFKHAFDGSGADNYFDAGSCIDGRLTSAWNWCSKLSKKPYYPLFKMAGFAGFDGNFGR